MTELEETVQDMKNSSRRRDDDNRRIVDDVKALQDLIPKAIKAQGENNDSRMKELNAELRSLKTLVSNRMGGVAGVAGVAAMPAPIAATVPGANMFGSQGTVGTRVDMDELKTTESSTGSRSSAANSESKRTFPSYGGSRGGIPAWQLAAAKKADAEQ
jgi:peroxin-14